MNRYLQAKLVKYQHLYIIETTASIPTKLSTDKHQQIHFVHGPNTHTTNPRWQTAAILKKRKITISQQKFDQLPQAFAR